MADRWFRSYPQICNPKSGGYGLVKDQHERLDQAAALDRELALQSASWGLFQIMGFHYERLGLTLQEFVNSAYRSTRDHLELFVRFILGDSRLVKALQARDWRAFARLYNGPGYAKNRYDKKMAAAYERLRLLK